ncbi:hypothetical protein [Agromyces ramosus]|uniref:J domain-containing protein n=1 Tax=Agromyces ramosus TaxID=33879 RepID=A0ABU0R9K5_9MICO|nr:hypothetical protein [Agromyces ramosus]MDQ0894447.1 hypothetical protein [Agromyces ramosus]
MSEWPDGLTLGPIREWPGELTPAGRRERSKFKTAGYDGYSRRSTPLSNTLEILDRELRMIGAKNAEMLVAIAPQDFRQDGKPRAQAKAEHPGVILSFDSRHGALSYPCDTFTTWQDNLRAIALSLEKLRAVDRYGVTTRGEQYRGFLALEAPTPTFAGFATVSAAELFIMDLLGDADLDGMGPRAVMRAAKRTAHPDTGGSAELFQKVLAAEELLS